MPAYYTVSQHNSSTNNFTATKTNWMKFDRGYRRRLCLCLLWPWLLTQKTYSACLLAQVHISTNFC